MPVTVKLDVDLSGWYAVSNRVQAALRQMGVIELAHQGVDWKGVTMRKVAAAGLAQGDNVFPVTDEARAQAGALIAAGLKEVAMENKNIRPAMEAAGELLRADITRVMLETGAPDGPSRTPSWNAFKQERWGSGGKNMVADGTFARSLKAKVKAR